MEKYKSTWLSFTRKERRGIIALVLLILFFQSIPTFYNFFSSQQKSVIQFQTNRLTNDSFEISDESKFPNTVVKKHSFSYNSNKPQELFLFDPNTLGEKEWSRLGVSTKTISIIQKYISKGGRFRKAEDLLRIWSLDSQIAVKLLPYVVIKNEERTSYPIKTEIKKSVKVVIDINIADSLSWLSLPGIGPVLSGRIVAYRKKLGGFYSIDQVGETFGLRDSVFNIIRPQLILEKATWGRININTADFEALKNHPYIRYQLAKAILDYRKQHGAFSSIEKLHNILVLTLEEFKKMQPYLKIE